jgi:hypothetical protein
MCIVTGKAGESETQFAMPGAFRGAAACRAREAPLPASRSQLVAEAESAARELVFETCEQPRWGAAGPMPVATPPCWELLS